LLLSVVLVAFCLRVAPVVEDEVEFFAAVDIVHGENLEHVCVGAHGVAAIVAQVGWLIFCQNGLLV